MVNIPLNDKWRLQSDLNNWILAREEKGRFSIQGYYSSIESALNAFIEKRLRASDSKSLTQLLNYHKSLVNSLKKALTPLNIQVLELKNGGEGDEKLST